MGSEWSFCKNCGHRLQLHMKEENGRCFGNENDNDAIPDALQTGRDILTIRKK